jgi:hypothetical protein
MHIAGKKYLAYVIVYSVPMCHVKQWLWGGEEGSVHHFQETPLSGTNYFFKVNKMKKWSTFLTYWE